MPRLMKPGIFASAVAFLWCRCQGEKKSDSVQTDAEISGGIKTLIRLIVKQIMNMSVPAVKSRSQHMAIRTESIVPMSAT